MIIKFLANNKQYQGTVKTISEHVVQVNTVDEEYYEGGFLVYKDSELDTLIGDYSEYKTEYMAGGYFSSNNTSEEPYYPSELDNVKLQKINELSEICNNLIIGGVDINIDGAKEHFSYKDEDQVNIKEIFDLAVQVNVPMYYHADNASCKLYTVEQIIELYATATTNKMHHVTYFNQLKLYIINTLETVEQVNKIEYGHKLKGEYLDTYNASMAQSQMVLEALLAKRTNLTE